MSEMGDRRGIDCVEGFTVTVHFKLTVTVTMKDFRVFAPLSTPSPPEKLMTKNLTRVSLPPTYVCIHYILTYHIYLWYDTECQSFRQNATSKTKKVIQGIFFRHAKSHSAQVERPDWTRLSWLSLVVCP